MKKIEPATYTGKVSMVRWLRDNDPDFLDVLKDTALIFGPLESVAYRHNDDEKQKDLLAWQKDQYIRLQEQS
ncbi:MAG: hypothetical protein AB2799_18985 [Candidatus Thiodiazotropha sp.]